jgi:hypothetical protein
VYERLIAAGKMTTEQAALPHDLSALNLRMNIHNNVKADNVPKFIEDNINSGKVVSVKYDNHYVRALGINQKDKVVYIHNTHQCRDSHNNDAITVPLEKVVQIRTFEPLHK